MDLDLSSTIPKAVTASQNVTSTITCELLSNVDTNLDGHDMYFPEIEGNSYKYRDSIDATKNCLCND